MNDFFQQIVREAYGDVQMASKLFSELLQVTVLIANRSMICGMCAFAKLFQSSSFIPKSFPNFS